MYINTADKAVLRILYDIQIRYEDAPDDLSTKEMIYFFNQHPYGAKVVKSNKKEDIVAHMRVLEEISLVQETEGRWTLTPEGEKIARLLEFSTRPFIMEISKNQAHS